MKRLIGFWFPDGRRDAMYERMANVLIFTARRHLPDWSVEIEAVNPEPYVMHAQANTLHAGNARKSRVWNDAVQATHDNELVCLIDGDTCITDTLSPVWHHDFDIAFTVKSDRNPIKPINSGIVFFRSSPRVRQFFDEWHMGVLEMAGDARTHRAFERAFAGIQQAALGRLLTRLRYPDLRILGISADEWNAGCNWCPYEPGRTRMFHLHSGALRHSIFGATAYERQRWLQQLTPDWLAAREYWLDTEAEAWFAEEENASDSSTPEGATVQTDHGGATQGGHQ